MVSLKYLLALLPLALALPTAENVERRDETSTIVPGKYIITFNQNIPDSILNSHMRFVRDLHAESIERRAAATTSDSELKKLLDSSTGVDKVWTDNFKGYSGKFDKETIKKINDSEHVVTVEPVMTVSLSNTVLSQASAPWNLAAISARNNPGSTSYWYDSTAGAGMWAYIIDTGLYTQNTEFQGRAFLGYNAYPDTEFVDNNGHGTHVAGTIGAKTYGVAKKANLMSVKVFDTGSSTTDIVLDGYEWAVNNITASGRTYKSVISMSLAGSVSTAFNTAIQNAYTQGVLTVVAAGNSDADASGYSPASAPNAITVGAIDSTWTRASFSNYGSLVDLFAPGVNVKSTWIGSTTATATLSGTSMACPHVAGISLLLRSKVGLTTPAQVTRRIKYLATKNKGKSLGTGSPNYLAYNAR